MHNYLRAEGASQALRTGFLGKSVPSGLAFADCGRACLPPPRARRLLEVPGKSGKSSTIENGCSSSSLSSSVLLVTGRGFLITSANAGVPLFDDEGNGGMTDAALGVVVVEDEAEDEEVALVVVVADTLAGGH